MWLKISQGTRQKWSRSPASSHEGVTKEDATVDNRKPTVDNGNKLVDKANKVVDNGNEVVGNKKTEIGSKLKTSAKGTAKPSSKSELNAAVVNGRKLLPRSQSKAGGVYLEPNRSKVEGGDGALSFNVKAPSGSNVENIADNVTNVPASEASVQNEEAGRTLISAAALNSNGAEMECIGSCLGFPLPFRSLRKLRRLRNRHCRQTTGRL
jgi:primase-polymerase (primpol)-like protein